ncbi:MAG: phospho-sugar mutase [Bacilli bacterium]|nr:phospho-sugar mutase [Bacilli bacterium]
MNNKAKVWFEAKNLEADLKEQLNSYTEEQLNDAFYTDITFGTGGMRGVIGAGTNRMNIYTLRRANYGYGKVLLAHYDKPSVAIAYDPRHKSLDFAKDSARVLASLGIKVFLFDKITPTPELSFAVRFLHATGGIVVTASHNPPDYNGYKIYDHTGCQYVPDLVDEVIKEIDKAPGYFDINPKPYDELVKEGLIEIIGKEVDEAFLNAVKGIQVKAGAKKEIKIVFTPLHGTSGYLGSKLLTDLGYDFVAVKEQMVPDGDFSTVKSPNPENASAFELAIKYAKEANADLVIATDPDADRLGISVLHNGEYKYLTGNQTGAVLINYLCKFRPFPKAKLFNTIVTGSLGAEIAEKHGIETFSTLTGFKYIGEQATLLEGTDTKFFFGYEESYGYVIGDFVRDKDSLQAITMISEAANYYHSIGKTLVDVLEDLYKEYGYHQEGLVNIGLAGEEGAKKIGRILNHFRVNNPAGFDIVAKEDYELRKRYDYLEGKESNLTLPVSNVIKFFLKDGSWFVLRPSGTEPKMKVYIACVAPSMDDAKAKVKDIENKVMKIVGDID